MAQNSSPTNAILSTEPHCRLAWLSIAIQFLPARGDRPTGHQEMDDKCIDKPFAGVATRAHNPFVGELVREYVMAQFMGESKPSTTRRRCTVPHTPAAGAEPP